MALSPGMKMMLVEKAARREKSEYAANDGRRMIGFARDENRNRPSGNYPRSEYNEYAEQRGEYDRRNGGDYDRRNGGDYNRVYGGEYDRRNGGDYDRRNTYPNNAEMRMPSYQAQPDMRFPMYPIQPDMRGGNTYGDIYAHGTLYAPGAMNKPTESRAYDQGMNEPVTEHKARKWVEKMSTGEHFKPEIAEQHRVAFCPNCDKWEYYVALNAMYADYKKTAQEIGMDKPDYYARLARDFIKDEDAAPGKVARYMETIPKK